MDLVDEVVEGEPLDEVDEEADVAVDAVVLVVVELAAKVTLMRLADSQDSGG